MTPTRKRLGVNIDHVATLRQARRGRVPEPAAAAAIAELSGADGITVHLREDRRHIQDRDLAVLKQVVTTRINLEMAATDEITRIACGLKPHTCTLVPEKREEITTEGGLDVLRHPEAMAQTTARLKKAGIVVRYSGTEPLLRIMVEGENLDEVETIVKALGEKAREDAR